MNTEKLIYAIGNIDEKYIYEANKKTKKHSHFLKSVAAIAAILLAVMFFHTEIGVKAVDYIKNITTEIFENIFPDKDIPVYYEGTTEYESHVVMGEIPDEETNSPGFSMYYDTERYELHNEDGIYYIRTKHTPISREEIIENYSELLDRLEESEKEAEIQRLIDENEKFYNNLPVCEIEIVRINATTPENAAEIHKKELEQKFNTISETEKAPEHNGVYFFVSDGDNWDSAMAHIYFIDDENGGVFRLTARFFGEASEGHGNRFRQMIDTFKVVH